VWKGKETKQELSMCVERKGDKTKQNKTKQELWKRKESISEDTAMETEKNFRHRRGNLIASYYDCEYGMWMWEMWRMTNVVQLT